MNTKVKTKTDWLAVIRRLFAEMWPGLACSAIWSSVTWFSAEPKPTLVALVATFFTTLFFISFFTGQVLRVRKQVGDAASFTRIEAKTNDLLASLNATADRLETVMTGGRTYPIVRCSMQGASAQLVLASVGGAPLFDVVCRIRDHGRWNRASKMDPHGRSATCDIEMATFIEGQWGRGQGLGLTSDRHDIDVQTTARNGRWSQLTAILKDDSGYTAFTKIIRLSPGAPEVVYQDPLPAGVTWHSL